MPSRLLVAGLDARSLVLAAPVLQRDHHVVREKASAADLLEELTGQGAEMVVLGSRLRFTDRGEHQLKGVPGMWRAFAVDGS